MKYLELLRAQLAALLTRHAAYLDELDALATDVESRGTATTPEETELARSLEADAASVNTEAEALRSRIEEMETIVAARANAPRPVVPGATPGTGSDVFDLNLRSIRIGDEASDIDSRARRALDGMRLNDDQKAHVERRLNDDSINARGTLARHILATGSEQYRSAFVAALGTMTGGYIERSHADALRTAQDEYRALSIGTDGTGGYLMPFTLDPTLIDINAGVANPIRRVARVRTTMTDNWQGVTDAGVTASWDAEFSEVSDDTPTLAQVAATIKHPRVFVPFSLEHEDDIPQVLSDMSASMGRAKDRLESAAFATGATGGSNPAGLVTLLVAATKTVASATTDTFAVADLYNLQGDLPDRYDDTATWLLHKKIVNLIRQFGTADSHALLTRLADGSNGLDLLGAPIEHWSSLDGVINATADNYIGVYGDIGEAFSIIDRLGMTVELIPHLFHTSNNLPSGQRGIYGRWRVGSVLTNADAARVLNVT